MVYALRTANAAALTLARTGRAQVRLKWMGMPSSSSSFQPDTIMVITYNFTRKDGKHAEVVSKVALTNLHMHASSSEEAATRRC